jgi:hypothetical protein
LYSGDEQGKNMICMRHVDNWSDQNTGPWVKIWHYLWLLRIPCDPVRNMILFIA